VFQLIWIIIAGFVVGGLARLLLLGQHRIPLWLTVLLGIAGAVAGNVLASVLGVRHTGGVDWIRHILQVGAAAVLIAMVAPVWARRHPSSA
jgi:uncharacterized membrane protein YeaQ/YmgE (transglycosylase-associated protein family)